MRPIEWYGNLTFLKQDWLTRNTAASDEPIEPRSQAQASAVTPPL